MPSLAWPGVQFTPKDKGPLKWFMPLNFKQNGPWLVLGSEAQGVQLDSQDRTKASAFPSVRKNHNQPQGVPSPSSRAESLGLTTFSRRTV